jgi:hypothetical protein
MSTYKTAGHRPVDGEKLGSHSAIADHFAELKARLYYGKTAKVGACRVNSTAQDGSRFEVEAFVGVPKGNGVVGRNVHFIVDRA